MQEVRFQRPVLPESAAIERYLTASRAARWFSNFGPCWHLLGERLERAVGFPCVPVANATLGLMVAIAVLRDRCSSRANEALMPSFAHPAIAQAAVWNALEPVFVDVSWANWQLCPDALRKALAARIGHVAVVMAVSALGAPPPASVRKQWQAACARAGVPLVVDSAAAYGAEADDGTPVGAQGDAEVVSFDAVKPVTAGEGGAVFFRTATLAEEGKRLGHFAFDATRAVLRRDGLNAKLSEPAAAIALASLDDHADAVERRRELADQVVASLPDGFDPQPGSELGTQQFVSVAAPDAATRSAVLEAANGRAELRTYYEPLHEMPAFASCARVGSLEMTEALGRRVLSLPMAVDLSSEEIETIADVVRHGCALRGPRLPVPSEVP